MEFLFNKTVQQEPNLTDAFKTQSHISFSFLFPPPLLSHRKILHEHCFASQYDSNCVR